MANSNDRTRSTDRHDITDIEGSELRAGTKTSDPEHYKVSDKINEVSDTIKSSTPRQTAAYMADMLDELRSMAEKSGHISLGEMLEFAHREAVWRSRADSERDEERDNSG